MTIAVSKVAQPYAEALISLAKENGTLKEMANDMNIVSYFLSKSSDLKQFLANPVITRDAKKTIVKDILGEEIHPNTLKILLILVDRNRISVLGDVAQLYNELYDKHESIQVAKIISSIELSEQQHQNLANKLKIITGAKQVKFALKVDPKLLGGFTVEIGSKCIDASVRGQLKQMSKLLGV